MASPNRQAPDIPTQGGGTEHGAEPDPAWFRGSWEIKASIGMTNAAVLPEPIRRQGCQ